MSWLKKILFPKDDRVLESFLNISDYLLTVDEKYIIQSEL